MKIHKIIVDKKPKCCIMCMMNTKTSLKECGEIKSRENRNGWVESQRCPDDRCMLMNINEFMSLT